MESHNDKDNENKDLFSYYYLINTFYLEIYIKIDIQLIKNNYLNILQLHRKYLLPF